MECLFCKDLVSASTDSQLKLWNVNQSYYVRSFQGKFAYIVSVHLITYFTFFYFIS